MDNTWIALLALLGLVVLTAASFVIGYLAGKRNAPEVPLEFKKAVPKQQVPLSAARPVDRSEPARVSKARAYRSPRRR